MAPADDLTPEVIAATDPAELRARSLDVSNTQYESGTGLQPVKASTPKEEIERIEADLRAVVVAPFKEGLPENRELAAVTPVAETPETGVPASAPAPAEEPPAGESAPAS